MRKRTMIVCVWQPAASLLLAVPVSIHAQQVDTARVTATPFAPCDSAAGSAAGSAARQRAHCKDLALATVLAVIHPGLGHYYVGEYHKGLQIEGIAVGSALAAVAAMTVAAVGNLDFVFGSSTKQPNNNAAFAVASVGLAVAAGTWIYGIIDAPRAARRENQRRAASAGDRR